MFSANQPASVIYVRFADPAHPFIPVYDPSDAFIARLRQAPFVVKKARRDGATAKQQGQSLYLPGGEIVRGWRSSPRMFKAATAWQRAVSERHALRPGAGLV